LYISDINKTRELTISLSLIINCHWYGHFKYSTLHEDRNSTWHFQSTCILILENPSPS